MTDRLAAFLEDLLAASGSIHTPDTACHTLYEASRLRGQKFVALVDGDIGAGTRERVFAGFNSPLLPEILSCTQVGQEGIDLHRHCRHVVHYDLAWIPAVLEQRTGRVDRIRSKTFRERALLGGETTFLEVGVPFLAGTYDERMYEELRLRAQTFEVLTGGDVGAENIEGHDDVDGAEGAPQDGAAYVTLPASLIADLREELHVLVAGRFDLGRFSCIDAPHSPRRRRRSDTARRRLTPGRRGMARARPWRGRCGRRSRPTSRCTARGARRPRPA